MHPAYKPSDFTEIAYIEPFSKIYYRDDSYGIILSDTLSLISRALMDTIMREHPMPHVTKRIEFVDEAERVEFGADLNTLIYFLEYDNDITQVKISKLMQKVISRSGQRYALIGVNSGIQKLYGTMRNQKGPSYGYNHFSMMDTHFGSKSYAFVMIFDAFNKNVVFFNSRERDFSPINRKGAKKSYAEMLSEFYEQKL